MPEPIMAVRFVGFSNMADPIISSPGRPAAPNARNFYEVTRSGTFVRSFLTSRFGSFSGVGLVFDGTNYRVSDSSEDNLFVMSPAGLSVSSFSTSAFGASNPHDVDNTYTWSSTGRRDASLCRCYSGAARRLKSGL